MDTNCVGCSGCGKDAAECACGCPLTAENLCRTCESSVLCKYCCGCGTDDSEEK